MRAQGRSLPPLSTKASIHQMRPTPSARIGWERFQGADDITNERNMLSHGGVKVPIGAVAKMIYKDCNQ